MTQLQIEAMKFSTKAAHMAHHGNHGTASAFLHIAKECDKGVAEFNYGQLVDVLKELEDRG